MSCFERKVTHGVALWVCVVMLGAGCTRHWAISHPQQQDLPLHESLWAMQGAKGRALLDKHSQDADARVLLANFESQIYTSYCGIASAVMALKSLKISSVSQRSFFTPKATAVRAQQAVFYGGMTLGELGALLQAHGATAKVNHAGDSSVEQFRKAAAANLNRAGDLLLVNYLRKAIHQRTGGHISPVAAYDADTDRVLILDSSSYKYPPVWVAVGDLFRAMNTVDKSANNTRGWIDVSPIQAKESES
ncbi:MAG TPA: glutathione gamma-glutamylcysteinyltransferase [Myxococcales bacterium]|nr:glutathione gamma-glutamylcysteinyltransferase [Myxococcales bacterium]HAN31697.1 glutathione gamma-glutamylcysteinyltransferase [Myxococcales bacterium]|tara:strand:+ start:538 stop:1281 length:744 start_codon:yes stop_codon:yes gene_type:complete